MLYTVDTIQSYFTFDVAMQESYGDPRTDAGAGLVAANAPTTTFATLASGTVTAGAVANLTVNQPSITTTTHCVAPVGSVKSLIRMVRLVSRGAIIEEIDDYGLLDQILTEVTTPRDELESLGFLEGAQAHGYDYQTKFAQHVSRWAPALNSNDGASLYRRFAFKLDKLGFFGTQHYVPLEWLPVTIEITFHQANACLRQHWTSVTAVGLTPSFYVKNPTFNAQLLTFNAEYTSAVNNKIATDGAVIPVKSWRSTTRFFTGKSDKMILSNKVKSLTRIMVVPRQQKVMNSYGLGMDQFVSALYTTADNTNIDDYGAAYATTKTELESYRFLIGSTPITDHSVYCLAGGAEQAMEMVKFFRTLGHDLSIGKVGQDTTYSTAGSKIWNSDAFKAEYGLICQNFNLEMVRLSFCFLVVYSLLTPSLYRLRATMCSAANSLIPLVI